MSKNPLKKHVVFVCTGNICRSAMAEGIFKYFAKYRPELTCESAGISAYKGFPASPNAIKVAYKYDVDISMHLSQPVTRELIEKADYVLVMTCAHFEALAQQYSEFMDSIHLLKAFANNTELSYHSDVDDPIGLDENGYEKCFFELEKAIKGVLEKI